MNCRAAGCFEESSSPSPHSEASRRHVQGSDRRVRQALALQGAPVGRFSLREAQHWIRGSRVGGISRAALLARAVRRAITADAGAKAGRADVDAYTSFGSAAVCGNPSRASGFPGTSSSRTMRGWPLEAIGSPSYRRNLRGFGLAASAQVSGKSKGQDGSTISHGRKRARGCTTPWNASRGSRPRHSLPSPISARSVTRNEVPEPISRFTSSRLPDANQSGNPNAIIADPAATATCCLLSNT